MNTKTENHWIIRNGSFIEGVLDGEVIRCTRKELITKGLRKLFLFWGIATLCILIPILHFVLVPTFLILGLFLGYKFLKNKFRIESGSFYCPDCKTKNSVKDYWFAEDTRFHCQNCGSQILIFEKDQLAK